MLKILKIITDLFVAEKTEYWHRNRSIEIVALEKNVDINLLKAEFKKVVKDRGRVEAISMLRRHFRASFSCAAFFCVAVY